MTVLGRKLYAELMTMPDFYPYHCACSTVPDHLRGELYGRLRWFDRPLYAHIIHSSRKGRL